VEKECCLPGVFCDSGDTPANLLCELNGHLMPCTSCFYGKWIEDVCVCVCVLANLEYLSVLFCAVLKFTVHQNTSIRENSFSHRERTPLVLLMWSKALGFQLVRLCVRAYIRACPGRRILRWAYCRLAVFVFVFFGIKLPTWFKRNFVPRNQSLMQKSVTIYGVWEWSWSTVVLLHQNDKSTAQVSDVLCCQISSKETENWYRCSLVDCLRREIKLSLFA